MKSNKRESQSFENQGKNPTAKTKVFNVFHLITTENPLSLLLLSLLLLADSSENVFYTKHCVGKSSLSQQHEVDNRIISVLKM